MSEKAGTELRDAHPFVVEALRHLDRRRASAEGILHPGLNDRYLHFAVSPAVFARTMRVADALLKLLHAEGHIAKLPRDGKGGLLVTVGDQVLRVQLREQLQQEKLQDTYGPRTVLKPTGRLELLIDEWLEGTRKRWADGKRRGTVEKQLTNFSNGLRIAADAKRALEARIQEQNRQWEEERRRREERAAKELREKRRADELEQEALRWQRSRLVREYLDAVEMEARRVNARTDPGTELGEWIRWGRSYADRIDPLRRQLTTETAHDQSTEEAPDSC